MVPNLERQQMKKKQEKTEITKYEVVAKQHGYPHQQKRTNRDNEAPTEDEDTLLEADAMEKKMG
eukprot:CAMPEP_0116035842 /NCGR_PEP_ID=MMETSP0321-20121206/20677_1 /TAXON_ID=163516 /ORGANISM="Leptocylindrus danicus var. danicus, Strain B650" /LENGTH=63 /DNA_ID=CAMNT_0003512889 /DNA_START=11 /DNA_END=202 /DNA_ORIENTATION=-